MEKSNFTEININTITSLVRAHVNVAKKEGIILLIEGPEDESLVEENLDRILDNLEIKLLNIELGHDNVDKYFVSLSVFKSSAELKFNIARILNISHGQTAPCNSIDIVRNGDSLEILVKEFFLIADSILKSSVDYSK